MTKKFVIRFFSFPFFKKVYDPFFRNDHMRTHVFPHDHKTHVYSISLYLYELVRSSILASIIRPSMIGVVTTPERSRSTICKHDLVNAPNRPVLWLLGTQGRRDGDLPLCRRARCLFGIADENTESSASSNEDDVANAEDND